MMSDTHKGNLYQYIFDESSNTEELEGLTLSELISNLIGVKEDEGDSEINIRIKDGNKNIYVDDAKFGITIESTHIYLNFDISKG